MKTISPGDFLRTKVVTSLDGQYWAAGVRLRITTNFEPILHAAKKIFDEGIPLGHDGAAEVRLRFWVEDTAPSGTPKVKPYFRGLDHLVFAGLDGRNSVLINLQGRFGIGRFTPEVASDANLWETVLFPALLTILGPSVGLTPLHCACVAWKGSGLLLAGESGAGKSTLSLALAQSGFDFLSDDRTLIGSHQGCLLAWGLSRQMKQRVESITQFPFLCEIEPNGIFKRTDELRFDARRVSGVHHIRCCEPRWIVFLERQSGPSFSLSSIPPHEAAWRLGSQLHRATSEAREKQRGVIEDLVKRECYRLLYGGDPRTVAGALHSLVVNGWKTEKQLPRAPTLKLSHATSISDDPLRRFRATPLSSEAHLMGRHISVETNSPIILNNVETFLNCNECSDITSSQFLWKIVTEPGCEAAVTWPPMTAFSDGSMWYVSLGQRCFIAVDHGARQAIGIIPEHLANDETGFSSVYLASMFYLTAPALGLVAFSAACVAMEGRGLLLFGVPGSGKTTASYLSTKFGLQFHADQAVFLEKKGRTLRAWGEFWPAAFREDALEFLPELAGQTRPLAYCDRTFMCVGKDRSHSAIFRNVTPVSCIFLQRGAGTSPKLIPIRQEEACGRLATSVPFLENMSVAAERESVFNSLGRLPAYSLVYGSDPSEAAVFLRSMLNTHHPVEDLS
ncbi:MAG: hypothetical protein EPN47_01785 [Acidobacteria bacterium]|nr:MAG: hypothetical protein EPN47_01785 [Acidobacteriota bacterium]